MLRFSVKIPEDGIQPHKTSDEVKNVNVLLWCTIWNLQFYCYIILRFSQWQAKY